MVYFRDYIFLNIDEIDSTNLEVRRIIQGQSDNFKTIPSQYFVLSAEKQTSGRGRLGNDWCSLDGNLHCSIAFAIASEDSNINFIPFVVALAVSSSLDNFLGYHKTTIKWPNDILVDNLKISGILLEQLNDRYKKECSWIIIGIGINILEKPQNVKNTCCLSECIITENLPNKKTILEAILKNYDTYFHILTTEGFASIRKLWLNKAINIGKIINIRTSSGVITGKFLTIDLNGNLVLDADGKTLSINSATIEL